MMSVSHNPDMTGKNKGRRGWVTPAWANPAKFGLLHIEIARRDAFSPKRNWLHQSRTGQFVVSPLRPPQL
jgi:hypothetical protein